MSGRRPPSSVLSDLYETQRMSTRDIAARFGVTHTQVRRWMDRAGIACRPHAHAEKVDAGLCPPPDRLRELVHVEHLSLEKIGERYGVSGSAVRLWLIEFGIPTPAVWDTRHKGERIRLPGADVLRVLYVDNGLSTAQIGAMHNASSDTVRRALRRHGIPIRPNGFDGGKRLACDDGHLVRSTYELRVDNWLHEHGIDHVVEPDIPGLIGCRADFLAHGWFIEIWGVIGNQRYRAQRARKIEHYRAADIPLIGLSPWMFCDARRSSWERRLSSVIDHPIPQTSPVQLQLPELPHPHPEQRTVGRTC